jgi:hypothetical protein
MMRVELPKTAAEAIVQLAYRGTADRTALGRIAPALAGRRSKHAVYVELELAPDQLTTLRAIAEGGGPVGLAALGKNCHDALQQLPKKPVLRRGPRDTPVPLMNRGAARVCVTCSEKFGPEHFAGIRGTRCHSCRSVRSVDIQAREFPGGAPGSAR